MAKPKIKQIIPGLAESYWYYADDASIHDKVFKTVNSIRKNQAYISERNLLHIRLYGNMEMMGIGYKDYATDKSPKPQQKLKINVIKSVIDTVVAKLARTRPRVAFVTDGGDHTKGQKAKRLSKFIDGAFAAMKFYKKLPKLATFGCIFDVGAMKFFVDDFNRPQCENTFPNELWVSQEESINNDPRSLFQVKPIAREVIYAAYPEFQDKIASAGRSSISGLRDRYLTDMIDVVEAWHLPDVTMGEKKEKVYSNGKHVICLDNCSLVKEDWELERFPFIFWRFSDRALGWWGQGLAEILAPIQIELNKLLRLLQEIMKWCVPKVLVESLSKVVSTHISNMTMGIMKYTGTKPEYIAPSLIPPGLFEQIENLFNKAFQIAGVSALSARSEKPPGLNSGVAIRESQDVESDRFVVQEQNYEQVVLDAAELTIDLMKIAAKKDPSLSVKYLDKKRGLEEIKWADVVMPDDDYEMQMYPTSMLPRTPAGRMAKVQEMAEAQWITPEEAMRMLDFPDTDAIMKRKYAMSEIMDTIIDDILDGRAYTQPEPIMKLGEAIDTMQMAYLRAKIDNVPEDKLEKMRDWIVAAKGLIDSATQPTPTPQMALPAGPEGGAPGEQPPPDAGQPPQEAPPMPMPQAA